MQSSHWYLGKAALIGLLTGTFSFIVLEFYRLGQGTVQREPMDDLVTLSIFLILAIGVAAAVTFWRNHVLDKSHFPLDHRGRRKHR